jgi:hypothetical protein
VLIKARHEVAHTVCTFKSAQSSSHGKWGACMYRQYRFGSSHRIDPLAVGFGYLGQRLSFLFC